ncbi:MAG: conserved phage C-terminal domain-containing protein [Lachnospirales bacterium]
MFGYLRLHRKIIYSEVFSDPILLKIWVYILCECAYRDRDVFYKNTTFHLKAGTMIGVYRNISFKLDVPKSTLVRKLDVLEELEMIEIFKENNCSIIKVLNYASYQVGKQKWDGNGTEMGQDKADKIALCSSSDVSKSEKNGTEMVTLKEKRRIKEINNKERASEDAAFFNKQLFDFLNEVCYKDFNHEKYQNLCSSLHCDFTLLELQNMIRYKAYMWLDSERMNRYLRPETLFGKKIKVYVSESKTYIKSGGDFKKEYSSKPFKSEKKQGNSFNNFTETTTCPSTDYEFIEKLERKENNNY